MKFGTRRDFLQFMGKASTTLGLTPFVSSCAHWWPASTSRLQPFVPTNNDQVQLSEGLSYRTLIKWGQVINSQDEKFGFNNDYIAFIPLDSKNTILWVNHEAPHPLFVSGYDGTTPRSRHHVELEQASVGGSLLKLKMNKNKKWEVVANDPLNRRIDGRTSIPFAGGVSVAGKKHAVGTLANCAGGVTPWNTILTCEENYYKFYGDSFLEKGERKKSSGKKHFYWDRFFKYPPEHYGWVVEVDPMTGKAQKHTSLGRFAHECATVARARDGRIVVYSGDDDENQCIYKFISDDSKSLTKGTLYVAQMSTGKWLPLNLKTQPQLKKYFTNDLDLLTHVRFAAHEIGATPLDRPEDIEIDPQSGHVYATLTNNANKGNFHGSILKIIEQNNDHGALHFSSDTFLPGGSDTGFSCPDNLVFDPKGNLWMTTDISGEAIGKPPYESFKSNGLFYIPLHGPQAGHAILVASAPVDAEFTGPCFSPDGQTLFLSVQHPGETTKSLDQLTSRWPHDKDGIPKPAVIAIDVSKII